MSYSISQWKKAVKILNEHPRMTVKTLKSVLFVEDGICRKIVNDYCGVFKVHRNKQVRKKHDEYSVEFQMSKIYRMGLKKTG